MALEPCAVRGYLFSSSEVRSDTEAMSRFRRDERKAIVARIEGVDPDNVEAYVKQVFDAQSRKWGAPLLNHLVYARRPSILKGARAMWAGLEASGLIDGKLQALINRRVAAINGCEF